VVAGANTVMDVMTTNQLMSPSPTTATDRFNNPSGAISVSDSNTYWYLPPAVYFAGDFTTIIWISLHYCHRYSHFIDCGNKNTFKTSDNILLAINGGQNSCNPYFNVLVDSSYMGYGYQYTESYGLPANGSWVHLAWSVTNSTGRLYANGVELNMNNSRVYLPVNVTRSQCYFGKSNWDGNPYADADFDEIKFFNRALSPAEIQNDFESIRSFMIQI
jgi:hypothetical protein